MSQQILSDLCRQVSQFLKEFTNCVEETSFILKKRKINDDTIIKLGYNRKQIIDVFYTLTPNDFIGGPEIDTLHGGSYWEFVKDIEGLMVYIKIKIQTRYDGTDVPYCYSFHESTHSTHDFMLFGII